MDRQGGSDGSIAFFFACDTRLNERFTELKSEFFSDKERFACRQSSQPGGEFKH